jgi:ketosteroid isomerase-like protein
MTSLTELTTDFTTLMHQYGAAFDDYDLPAILNYYTTPCFVYKSQKLLFHETEEAKKEYYGPLLEQYREAGIDHSELPEIEVTRTGDQGVLITVRWICRAEDKEAIWDFRDSYWWVDLNGEWKIIGDMVHESEYSTNTSQSSL